MIDDKETVHDWFTKDPSYFPDLLKDRKKLVPTKTTLFDKNNHAQCRSCKGSTECQKCDESGQIHHDCGCEYCYENWLDCSICNGTNYCQDCNGLGHYEYRSD